MIDAGTVASSAPDVAAIPPDYVRSREQAIADAMAAGLTVCEPADNELFLDIDSDAQWSAFHRSIRILRERHPLDSFVTRTTPSKSGNRHVRVRMPWSVSNVERIAWQAALGSDPVRELLSLIDLRNGDERPTLFFEKSDWNDPEPLPF